MLFNPSVEYANEKVCLDIDITMSYFALHCFDLPRNEIGNFDELLKKIETFLKTRIWIPKQKHLLAQQLPNAKLLKMVAVPRIHGRFVLLTSTCVAV